jgi:hypothetical protein
MASNPIAEALENPTRAPGLGEVGDYAQEMDLDSEEPPFPAGGPVKCLGISSDISGSQRCYYLNYNGQLVALEAGNKHGKNAMVALYGPHTRWLELQWGKWSAPKVKKDPQTGQEIVVQPSQLVDFDQAKASRALIVECTRRGIFDPTDRMRGRGAHRLDNGEGMAFHCGDKVLISTMRGDGSIRGWRWEDCGLIGGNVYPAAMPIRRPWHEPVDCQPAEKLLTVLQTWNFKRELLDARFVLGAVGAGFVAGWLRWRPAVWITGGKGTGKSTLNGKDGLIHSLFGEGVFRSGSTTAAGLRQRLRNSTVPVMLDEIEASANNQRVQEVIELMRLSASGDSMTKGGNDHNAHEFTLQSSFWFSSILVPPLEPQDLSRLALCQLKPLRKDLKPLDLDELALHRMGPRLHRRMIDGLPRLSATKAKFHAALSRMGHEARACDQFGTLLACADLLINDWHTEDRLPTDEEVAFWAQRCHPGKLSEISEAVSDHQSCIDHLITFMVQSRGGDERQTLGRWIEKALDEAIDPPLDSRGAWADRLHQHGLKLVSPRYNSQTGKWGAETYARGKPAYLAVAWAHQALNPVFMQTKWQGGVWRQSLERHENAITGIKTKFGHSSLTAVLVPLHVVLDESELPEESTRAGLREWMEQNAQGAEV